jgi:hypothetical protein
MGYPFDRRFPDGVIATLAVLSNVGLHAISIRHESTALSTARKCEFRQAMDDRVRGKPSRRILGRHQP